MRRGLEAQISEFGQTPKQLFTQPHPSYGTAIPAAFLVRVFFIIILCQRYSFFTNSINSKAKQSPPRLSDSLNKIFLHHQRLCNSGRWVPLPGITWRIYVTTLDVVYIESLSPSPLPRVRKNLTTVPKTTSKVTAVCLGKSGDKVYSVSEDTTLKIYSLAQGRQLRSTQIGDLRLSSLCLPPEENPIFIGSWDNNM